MKWRIHCTRLYCHPNEFHLCFCGFFRWYNIFSTYSWHTQRIRNTTAIIQHQIDLHDYMSLDWWYLISFHHTTLIWLYICIDWHLITNRNHIHYQYTSFRIFLNFLFFINALTFKVMWIEIKQQKTNPLEPNNHLKQILIHINCVSPSVIAWSSWIKYCNKNTITKCNAIVQDLGKMQGISITWLLCCRFLQMNHDCRSTPCNRWHKNQLISDRNIIRSETYYYWDINYFWKLSFKSR